MKMTQTLTRLVAEHDRIDRAATNLLLALDDASEAELAAQLRDLAEVVYEHVAAEDVLMQRLKAAVADVPEGAAWRDGAEAFERLRGDWLTFLHRWDGPGIARERSAFVAEARPILERLRERVELETDAFHAAAIRYRAVSAH